MTNLVRGQSHTLTAEFFEYVGGPSVDLTGLTIKITRVSDNVIILGPTSVGIQHPGTGVYTYIWDVTNDILIDDYIITWTGTDPEDDVITAVELVGVIGLNSSTGTGPCDTWPVIWGACDLSGAGVLVTGDALQAATEVLWLLSGQRFGQCTVTLRPCKRTCLDVPWPGSLWPAVIPGMTYPMPVNLGGGQWLNLTCGSCTRGCSCGNVEEVLLPAPIYAVTEVKIDGEILSSTSYRVDDHRLLVRTDGGSWPQCNDLSKNDDEVDTWSVTAQYGEDVPVLAKMAMGELACEFVKLFVGDDCSLPQPIQSLVRQGVSITYLDPNEMLANGRVGLRMTDMFLQVFNPHGLQTRAKFYDVDGPGYRVAGLT